MNVAWEERNPIVANLFNPAFCGEVIRVAIQAYNANSKKQFSFALSFLILPILLHKETRDRLPRSTRTHLFVWIQENENLFLDFSKRSSSLVKFTKESLTFLIAYKCLQIMDDGSLVAVTSKTKPIGKEFYEEYNHIMAKAQMLGKWLATTSDVKSIYSFFRITP